MTEISHKSRVLLFTGDGKGKTTAALGMALRAAGHGLPTLIVSFIKADTKTGEIAACKMLPDVEVRQVGCGFIPHDDASPKMVQHRRLAADGLRAAAADMATGRYHVVVLDEICTAVARGLIAEAEVCDAVNRAADGSVVVLTGRGATPGLLALADTATEMRCLKHGYYAGHLAQAGVEY